MRSRTGLSRRLDATRREAGSPGLKWPTWSRFVPKNDTFGDQVGGSGPRAAVFVLSRAPGPCFGPRERLRGDPLVVRVVLERDPETDSIVEHAPVLDREVLPHNLSYAQLSYALRGGLDSNPGCCLP